MKCEDCELLLAQNERNAELEEHLRACPKCLAIEQDLAANALALAALRDEEMPGIVVKAPSRARAYGWLAAAAAAAFVAALLLPRTPPASQPEPPKVVVSQAPPQPPPPVRGAAVLQPQKFEPLKIKMLTSDPDVVIYWLIDN